MRASFLLLSCVTIQSAEVELDLVIQANSNTAMTYQVGTSLVDPFASQDSYSTTLTYSGNILATAEVEASSGKIETIRFHGGTIATEDVVDTLNVTVGATPYLITFRTQGITRTTMSTETETVSSNGFLDGGLHLTSFTGGIIEASNFPALTGSPSVTEETDLATETSDLISPLSLFPDFTNLSSIGTTQTSATLFERTFEAQLFSRVQVPALAPDAPLQAAGQSFNQQFRQRYFENGNLSAVASFSLPTAFGQWAIDQNLSLSQGTEVNASRIPFTLLFALNLDPQAASLPITFQAGSPVIAHLQLPEEGLRFQLGVEYSPDLQTEFQELDPSFLLDGVNSLKVNRTGITRIAFPEGEKGYFRFTAQP